MTVLGETQDRKLRLKGEIKMNLQDIAKQAEQMDAFQAGYKACLQWIAEVTAKEEKAKENVPATENK